MFDWYRDLGGDGRRTFWACFFDSSSIDFTSSSLAPLASAFSTFDMPLA